MSDLTEAIEWVKCELRPYEAHPDLIPEPAREVLDAARLVADGKVIPVEAMQPIRWCVEHHVSMPFTEADVCWLRKIDLHLGAQETPCRIVDAALHLPEREVAE